jgi:hypothetical protein
MPHRIPSPADVQQWFVDRIAQVMGGIVQEAPDEFERWSCAMHDAQWGTGYRDQNGHLEFLRSCDGSVTLFRLYASIRIDDHRDDERDHILHIIDRLAETLPIVSAGARVTLHSDFTWTEDTGGRLWRSYVKGVIEEST